MQKYNEENPNEMENINNISFDLTANKFVIEDTFFKLSYRLPKTLDQINFFSTVIRLLWLI